MGREAVMFPLRLRFSSFQSRVAINHPEQSSEIHRGEELFEHTSAL